MWNSKTTIWSTTSLNYQFYLFLELSHINNLNVQIISFQMDHYDNVEQQVGSVLMDNSSKCAIISPCTRTMQLE